MEVWQTPVSGNLRLHHASPLRCNGRDGKAGQNRRREGAGSDTPLIAVSRGRRRPLRLAALRDWAGPFVRCLEWAQSTNFSLLCPGRARSASRRKCSSPTKSIPGRFPAHRCCTTWTWASSTPVRRGRANRPDPANRTPVARIVACGDAGPHFSPCKPAGASPAAQGEGAAMKRGVRRADGLRGLRGLRARSETRMEDDACPITNVFDLFVPNFARVGTSASTEAARPRPTSSAGSSTLRSPS